MNKLEALNILNENSLKDEEREKMFLARDDYFFKGYAYRFILGYEKRAWNAYFNEKDITKTKNLFTTAGYIDFHRTKLENSRAYDQQNTRDFFINLAFSDNQNLISCYKNFDYQVTFNIRNKIVTSSFLELAYSGELVASLSLCSIHALINDFEQLEKSVNNFNSVFKKRKTTGTLIYDFNFFKALLSKNKDEIKSSIEYFLQPKSHKKRTDNIVLRELISKPAILYAKLSWINGIEIEFDNPLIPMDLLPIKPVEYDDNYINILNGKKSL